MKTKKNQRIFTVYWIIAIVVLLLIGITWYTYNMFSQIKVAPPPSQRNPISQINGIIAGWPWKLESIGPITGLAVKNQEYSSGGNLTVFYEGKDKESIFKDAELRQWNLTAKDGPEELLILNVKPGNGIDRRQIREQFGQESDIGIPSAHDPNEESPMYLIYTKPWGSVSFGFSPSGNEELARIIFDTPTITINQSK